ncbi:MATE family efflux transporter [Leptolyngbya sp. NIES-2104]|uniref:MATE family efflux transporter n=1 Tax=Leptolyngbya sp. NIES-2104 TaxID=1552121 RepID=UPI0006EC515A|nr:MATE family efflux transporter [Leptolyngbya sp. NIES-2104]GAP96044.1 multi antimicrobial extrusion protein (Na(+)/drug antiporter), MATE family of MDR efflux pumps [Leptolyngbya sp. NIES-2104]
MNMIRVPSRIQSEVQEFLKLAIPLASAQVAQSATGFADTIMMGRMGAEILAGGGLAAIIYLSIMATTSSMVMGVSPLIAEAFGAGQKTRTQQLARQGLWLSLIVTIPMMIVTGSLDRWMIHTGQTETTVRLANTYLDIMLWGLFPAVGFAALRATVSALSQARPVMIIVIVGTAFNIVGNYILGFGEFGFPEMGLAGLALSSVLALWGMFLALALYIFLHPKLRDYRVFQELHRIRPKILWELAWVGVPIGLFSGLEMGFFMVTTFWMGTLGTAALAAHQIVFQTIVVIFMVPLGISFATTVRVGQWLGKQDILGIQQATWVSLIMTVLFMSGVSIAVLLFPKQVIGIYLDVQNPENAAIISLAIPLLIIAAIAQVLDGFQKAVYGSLQGLQDTQIPMVLNVLGYWGVGLSAGYLLGFHLGLGSTGLWIGQSIAIAVVAMLFAGRLLKLIAQRKQLNSGS